MGRVGNFLRQEPGDWFFGRVRPAGGTATATQGTLVEAESAYVSLYLEAMRVSAIRVRGQSFYGR
jgi:hypothetical protein